MFRKIAGLLLVISCLSFNLTSVINAQAFKVPNTQSTNQWSIRIDKPILDRPNTSKPKPGIADMYSMVVKNNGNTLYDVTIDVYRNEPNSPTKFGLFSNSLGTVEKGKTAFQHLNFPVSVHANEIEVIISWHGKAAIAKDGTKIPGRKFKESFVFKTDN
ncbi:hypothetical protein [Aneurinibacillus migulanus]|uniref:hypothetical protein n=1 Tax=Aneurinibacillus migulanus TaxID=47500 RepID=UPI000696FD2C|nr:hypothetical protein [Aneurinibacillus migulanus]